MLALLYGGRAFSCVALRIVVSTSTDALAVVLDVFSVLVADGRFLCGPPRHVSTHIDGRNLCRPCYVWCEVMRFAFLVDTRGWFIA